MDASKMLTLRPQVAPLHMPSCRSMTLVMPTMLFEAEMGTTMMVAAFEWSYVVTAKMTAEMTAGMTAEMTVEMTVEEIAIQTVAARLGEGADPNGE